MDGLVMVTNDLFDQGVNATESVQSGNLVKVTGKSNGTDKMVKRPEDKFLSWLLSNVKILFFT